MKNDETKSLVPMRLIKWRLDILDGKPCLTEDEKSLGMEDRRLVVLADNAQAHIDYLKAQIAALQGNQAEEATQAYLQRFEPSTAAKSSQIERRISDIEAKCVRGGRSARSLKKQNERLDKIERAIELNRHANDRTRKWVQQNDSVMWKRLHELQWRSAIAFSLSIVAIVGAAVVIARMKFPELFGGAS